LKCRGGTPWLKAIAGTLEPSLEPQNKAALLVAVPVPEKAWELGRGFLSSFETSLRPLFLPLRSIIIISSRGVNEEERGGIPIPVASKNGKERPPAPKPPPETSSV
jgi:hypothetical protein